jgi:hypothetical protein
MQSAIDDAIAGVEAGSLTITEVDGSPSVSATTIKFPNGTVTDNGAGVVTITGLTGATGAAGATGETGSAGATGATGAAGPNTVTTSTTTNITGLLYGDGDNVSAVQYTGLTAEVQAAMGRKKIASWVPAGNTSGVPGVFGFSAPTTTGFTVTARTVATTDFFARSRRLGYVTAASVGSVGQWRASAAQFTVGDATSNQGGFLYVYRFGISDAAAVSGARMFVGLSPSGGAANVEPSTLTNLVGVGHGASDTNFKIFYAGSSTQTPIDLGANFPSNTQSVDLYELVLYSARNSGNVEWAVTRLNTGHTASGTIINSGSTVLPTNTTLIGPWGYRTNNATALAVGLDVVSMHLETDY